MNNEIMQRIFGTVITLAVALIIGVFWVAVFGK